MLFPSKAPGARPFISGVRHQMEREVILPIIVPRTYFQFDNWPGPYKFLKHPELAVTWVDTSKPDTMLYVNFECQKQLEATGESLHSLAMHNLRAVGMLTTHEKVEAGKVIFRAMMHSDGLGTSRLLLLPELAELYPEGYVAGIPERSCGVVTSKILVEGHRHEVLEMVNACYERGTTPMLPGFIEAEQFQVLDA